MTQEEALRFVKEAAEELKLDKKPEPSAVELDDSVKQAMAVSAMYGLQLLQNKIYGLNEG